MKTLLSLAVLAFSATSFAVSTEHPLFLEKMANPEAYVAQPTVSNFALRSICGASDLQYVNDYDGSLGVTKEFVDAHKTSVGKMNGVICTGTLIGEDLFITASHCVGNKTVSEEILFDYEYEAGSNTVLLEQKIYKVTDVVEDGMKYGLDFAVLRLEGQPGLEFGYKTLNKKPLLEGDNISIIQHPGGRPKMVEVGSVYGFNTNQLLYGDLDTEGGSSGSGVLDSDGLVIGIHTHGGCYGSSGQNKGTRVERMAQESALIDELATPQTQPL